MGGGMSMDTELERGTCVSFWIPLQEADGTAQVGTRIILRPRTQKAEKISVDAERDNGFLGRNTTKQ
jgi:hypothetical protein